MARIRYIKPDISLDEELASKSMAARLLFRDLWCHLDKAGRCEDRPRKIKALIFPWDDVDVDRLLEELGPHFIVRYEAAGKRYIQVPGFTKHQKTHHTEKESEIPAPKQVKPLDNGVLTVKEPLKTGGTGDWNGNGNGNGNGEGKRSPLPSSEEPKPLQFGLHHGEPLSGLPPGYCKWVLTKCEERHSLSPDQINALEDRARQAPDAEEEVRRRKCDVLDCNIRAELGSVWCPFHQSPETRVAT